MRAGRLSLPSLFVILPVLVFVVLVWVNWGPVKTVGEGAEQVLRVRIGGGLAVEATLAHLLMGTFCFGLLMGLLAAFIAISRRLTELAEQIEALQHDKRRLGAANRALEAALPVLRERYDQAIGALDPVVQYGEPGVDGVGEVVPVAPLAIEDAEARRQAREQAAHGN